MNARTLLGLIVALGATLTLLPALPARGARLAPAKPVSVFLLRHAEAAAASQAEPDPGLTELGRERAEALARLLGRARITHLFATDYRRTCDTLMPLARELGLDVLKRPAAEIERQAGMLRELPPGSVAVVAGHSNTIPALALALGAELDGLVEHPTHGAMLAHDEHERLFLLTLPAEKEIATQLVELRIPTCN